MKHCLLFIFTIISSIANASSVEVSKLLDAVEASYVKSPDSALVKVNTLLQTYDLTLSERERAHYFKAKCFERQYRLDSAKLYFEQVLALGSEERVYDVLSYYRLGVIASRNSDIEQERQYFLKAYDLLPQIPQEIRAQLLIYNALGNGYTNKNDVDSALYYLQKGIDLAKEHPEQSEMEWNLNYASVKALKSDLKYHDAFDYAYRCLEISQETQNKLSEAKSNIAIGVLFLELSEYDKSLQRLSDAYQTFEENEAPYWLGITSYNMALIYEKIKDYDQALDHGKRCYAIAKSQSNKRYQGKYTSLIAKIYYRQGQLDQMYAFASEGFLIAQEYDNKELLIENGLELMRYHLTKGNNIKAKALSEQIEPHLSFVLEEFVVDFYQLKSLMLNAFGRYRESMEALTQVNELIDDIAMAESELKLRYFEDKQVHEAEKFQLIETQKYEKRIHDQELEFHRWLFVVGILLILLLSGLVFVFYRYYKLKARDNQLLVEINKKVNSQKEALESKNQLIEAQREELRKMDEYKSRFFRNISHEFRTPLTLILSPITDLIKEQSFELSSFESIKKNAEKLLKLINQILELSRLQATVPVLQLSQVDLKEQIALVFAHYQSNASDKNIDLDYRISVAQEVFLSLDILDKVLSNLLSNALKHTPKHGNISLKVEQEGQYLDFVFSDSGKGISSEEVNHIFKPFYTSDDDNTMSSGIGLTLTKELIENHGGTIHYEGTESSGAIFRIKLPCDLDYFESKGLAYELEENINIEPSQSDITDETSPIKLEQRTHHNAKVLVVEDNIDLNNYICKILAPSYKVISAQNGKQGVEKAIEMIPDLIISDLMMPELDGNQLLETLKQNPLTSHIPVIMLTARADNMSELESLDKYADDYITKPFETEYLLLKVRNILSLKSKLIAQNSDSETENELEQLAKSEFCLKIIYVIKQNLSKVEFSVEDLADELAVSRSQLHRKLSAETGLSTSHFMRRVRLHEADNLLKSGNLNVSEVAFQTGFSTPNYFSKCYKEYFGTSPSAVIKKFEVSES